MAFASITKTFVAAEVMTLASRGLVDLEAPANTYVQSPLLANGATVRQLLEMRSGLTDPPDSIYAPIIADNERHWDAAELLAQVGAPTTTPGARYAYTGTNYWLLGNLIESVGGRPLAQALRADLLDPAGLERVAVQDAEALTPPISKPTAETPGTALPAAGPYIPTRAIASASGAAGAMAGDAASAARWGYLLYGGLLLPAESLQEMTDFADGDGYGLGTAQMDVAGHSAVGHIGETEGYRSVLVVIPQRRLSVAVLTASTTQTAPLAPLLLRAGQLIP